MDKILMDGMYIDVDRMVHEHVVKYFQEHPGVDLLHIKVPDYSANVIEYARGGLIENDGKQHLDPDKPVLLLTKRTNEAAPMLLRAYDCVKALIDERGITYL